MQKTSIAKLLVTTLSVLVMTATMAGYSVARSQKSGDNNRAIANLETIKENHMATVRQEALKADLRSTPAATTGHASTWMTRVNAHEVNMVTNMHEAVAQKEITIDGKTYYGSCKGCADNMLSNTSTRFARDPYTNNLVDKSEAVIYSDSSGRTWYFESNTTQASFVNLASQDTVYGYSEPK